MYEEEVARGAAILDEAAPGWDAKIDLGILSLGDTDNCVLGQLYGGFGEAIKPLGWRVVDRANGFSTGEAQYPDLDAAWKDFIQKRREKINEPATA